MIRALALIHLTCMLPAAAQLPAFPGAEGAGAFATGGRGGDVYYVTNLNSSGAGSFADAIATVPSSGRTIVFAVSGYIRIPSGSGGMRLTRSKVTIAGQTAPGDGIGFFNNSFRISASDVVVRHARFRYGKQSAGGDCINLDSLTNRCVLDHVSMQFSTDENMSSISPPDLLTLQHSLNAWGLQSHSAGGLWDVKNATSVYNLFAHNHTRNPKARPSGLLEWINNVNFDWNIGFIMGDSSTPASWKSNVIGNYFVCPPGNLRSRALEKANLDRNGVPNFTLHAADNLFDKNGNPVLDGSDVGYGIASGSYHQSATRMPINGGRTVIPVAPRFAYKRVVSSSGALRLNAASGIPIRDEVDTRLIDNLVNLRRNIISRESDLPVSNSGFGVLNSAAAPLDTDKDGMSDAYETALGWNVNSKDHNTALASSGGIVSGIAYFPAGTPAGYTRLEEYLHFLASPHAIVARNTASEPNSLQVDLSRYTLGFNGLSPVFSVSGVIGGSESQSGPGGRMVTFIPTPNHTGRARFEFTVTDAEGDTWTQSFLVLVSSIGVPRNLVWNGDGSGNVWNTSAANWSRADGTPSAFVSGDHALFDDRGSASPSIQVPANLTTGTLTFDSAKNYTISGSGGLAVGGPLTKRGTGNLTIANDSPNSFSSIINEAGGLVIQRPITGTAPIRLEGGSLTLSPVGGHISSPLEFNAPTVVNVTTQHDNLGHWSGSGDVTIHTSAMWTIYGSWNNYSGRISFGPNASLRLNGSTNTNFGSPSLAIDLGEGSTQFYNRNGNLTIALGTLTGGPNTQLQGAQSNAAASTYSIGARNEDAIFHGAIVSGKAGNSTAVTHITKVGSGTWTLTGNSSHTGNTIVSAGTLLMNGSASSSPVTVSSGATVGGSGSFGSTVAVNSGGFIAPGAEAKQPGILTTNGLTIAGATLRLDLGETIAGANDRIVVSSGSTSLTGSVKFEINRLGDTLEAGSYPIITGGSTLGTSSFSPSITGLPGTTRQSFSIQTTASPGTASLQVTGTPGDLVWTGANGGVWDLNTTAGNWTGATPDTFRNLDLVTFADGAANPAISLNSTVQPARIVIDNTAQDFALTGGGAISGTTRIVKRGPGSFSIGNTGPNTFTGGTTIEAGTLALASATAQLGSGEIELAGGTLRLPDAAVSLGNSIVVSGNAALVTPFTGATNIANSATARITSTGDPTLDLQGLAGILSINGDLSGFVGTIALGSGPGMIRLHPLNLAAESFGSPSAHFDLGSGSGKLNNRNGNLRIELGALSGGPGTLLSGRQTGSGETESVYRIGARNLSTTFAGTISHLGDLAGVTIVKTGTSDLTLSGDSDFTGAIAVESGILTVSGSTVVSGNAEVAAEGRLSLSGGTLGAGTAIVAGELSGHGTLAGDLNCIGEGIFSGHGFSSGTAGVFQVNGNASFGSESTVRLLAGHGGDSVSVTGDLTLAGTVQVSLVPGTGFGRHTLFTCGGTLEADELVLAGIPAGVTAHLSGSIEGRLDLVIDDSDENGLPDSWEMEHFGTIGIDPDGDDDGDGQSNAAEFLGGTDPKNGASFFAATLRTSAAGQWMIVWPSVPGRIYQIQSSASLDGGWSPVATVPAAVAPAAETSHEVPADGDRCFYRVLIQQ